MKDSCGIFAAYDLMGWRNVVPQVIDGLNSLQHRGQLSAGIAYHHHRQGTPLKIFKANGLVKTVFKEVVSVQSSLSETIAGTVAIGHVRYATCGSDDPELVQPFEWRNHDSSGNFAFCFAGHVTNYLELVALVERAGFSLRYGSDAEALTAYLGLLQQDYPALDLWDLFRQMQLTIDGAFNCAYLDVQGNLLLYRDKHGFRPLHYLITDNGLVFFASETNALLQYGRNIQTVKPGELLYVNKDLKQVKSIKLFTPQRSHCFFEYVYFSHLASTFEGVSIYEAREKLGKNLAAEENELLNSDDCIVISVPESATLTGRTYASTLQISHKEAIIANRYAGRTFIERESAKKAYQKYAFVAHLLENKRVFIVDDSLVRATTIQAILELMKQQCNPKETHLRIASPPIFYPCFYGIDIPSQKELFAPAFALPLREGEGILSPLALTQMAKTLGVQSLRFLSIHGLMAAINIPFDHTCLACINAQYPTAGGTRLFNQMQPL